MVRTRIVYDAILINDKQSHSMGSIVCQLCGKVGSVKFKDFYHYSTWEVCGECLPEAKKIEARKLRHNALRTVKYEVDFDY